MAATSGGLNSYRPAIPTNFCCRKASESRTTNIALLVVVFLVGCFAATATGSRNIAIRVGATIGRDGPCAAVFNDTALGYKYFFDWFAQQPAPVLTDVAGRNFTLKFQFQMVTHNCTESGRAAAMNSLIDGTTPDPATGTPAKLPVHVIFGGNGENAAEDALQADAASRLLLHCCTARDSVFKMDLPHVYGLFTPASMYTSTVLRAMALRGLKKVAVVYDRDSPLFVQLCEGALADVPLLGELRPGFKRVLAENYTVSDTLAPGFWEHLALNVSASGADALIACDDMSRTSTLLHLLSTTHHHHLSAIWLASWGNPADFLSYLDGHGELTLTTMQWLPTLPYADPTFGTAAQYGEAFAAATGRNATYFSAAASVAGYVLLSALTRAVSMCKLTELNATNEGDVDVNVRAMAAGDAFMWQEGSLECTSGATRGSVMLSTTGSGALRYVLNNLNLETFFGPVGFNGFRQNVRHPAITAQVHNGQLAAVLPLDVADTALVMPIPAPLPPHAAWRSTPTGISIITLIGCVGSLFALLLLFMVKRRRFGIRLSMAAAVSIRFDEIQVDYPPVLFANGDGESGEGMYKGTRVKLVVATEIMSPPSSSRQALKQSPPSVLSFSPAEDTSVHKNRDRSQKPRATTFSLISIPVSPRPTTTRLTLSELSTPQAPLQPSASPPPHQHQQQQLALGNAASAPSPFLSFGTTTLNTTTTTVSTSVVRPADVMLSDRSTFRKMSVSDAGFRRPSDSALGKFSNCPLPTMSTSLASGVGGGTGMPAGGSGCVGGGGGGGVGNRLLSALSFGPMSKRNRDQALSLIWRDVRLQHPRMCPILGIVLDWPGLTPNGGSGPVVVRQWYEFDNLDRLLDNETVPLPLLTRANIAIGVAEGLSFLHAQQPPILAGPIEPARIIIDKHFNPRLFLRLRNLDPNYAKEAAAAAAAVARSRAVTGNPTRGMSMSQVASVTWGQLRLLAPPSPEVPVLSATAGADAGNMGTSTAQTANTVVVPFGNGRDSEDSKQQPLPPTKTSGAVAFAPSNTGFRGSGGGGSGSAIPDSSTVIVPTGGSGGLQNSVVAAPPLEDPQTAWLRGGGGAAADATVMMSPYLPYVPSKAQDVFEFGLLLCRLFAPSSPSDSGRMRLALRFANVSTAAAVAEGSGGVYGGDITTAVPAPISTYDDVELEAALEEMSDICNELANLARACMRPGTTLSFPAVLRTLEQEVLPALTAGCTVGSSPGLRKLASGGTGHWVYDKVSSLRKRVAGFGKVDEPNSGAGEVVGSCSVAGRETRGSVNGLVNGQHMVHRSGGSAPRLGPHLRHLPRAGGHPIITPDDLLFDIFPPKVARALQAGETVQPERYDCVSIFFSDVVGYTDLCGQLQPGEVMDLVHRLYSKFDDLIRELQLFKVETVGDAYLAVGNLRWPQADSHARLMTQFAFSAIRAANSLTVHHDMPELGTVHIRVGLHCGPVVGSVVGTLNRRYCLFGDAVNTAARMEHTSQSDRVHCSAAFAALLTEQWPQGTSAISRGVQQIKGKGPMETFWVEERSLAPVEPAISLYGDETV